jgi:hypothetical protein
MTIHVELLSKICIEHPQRQETVDADGIRTITEITTNEDGKKVKVRIHLFSSTREELNNCCRSSGGYVVWRSERWLIIKWQNARPGPNSGPRKALNQVLIMLLLQLVKTLH